MNAPAESTAHAVDSPSATPPRPGPNRLRLRLRLPLYGAAVLLVSLNMRPAIAAVSPLLDDIKESTGTTNTVVGVVSTLPLICSVALAPLAPRLARRFGMTRILLAVLLILLGGVAVRLAPSLPPLFAGTVLVGSAIAVANVIVPALIKRDFPRHVGLMSGLHTTMLVGGGALAAGLTVPLRDTLGLDWPGGLAVWGVLILLATAVWSPLVRRGDHAPGTATPRTDRGRGLRRDRLAWAVTLFYACQSLLFYTVTTWLPTLYTSHEMSESRAGALLSLCFGSAVVTALVVPVWAGRSARQSHLAVAGSALCAIGVLALAVAPTAAPALWSAVIGLGLGAVLSLGIAFMSMRARDAHDAGLLAAMSHGVGYLIAAIGPVLFGFAKDTTGTWTPGLLVLALAAALMALAGTAAGRGGHVTSR
ncbi:MFS transporter [Streptomyces sp. NPDC006645]|uniref:CynX/NimT family MFS transporter n=1 Tax=unclassified Streptomyces TaxID=2593676 RepID=UPI0033B4C5BB